MIFERIEVQGLAHYSYLVGCPKAGAAAVIDPKRDVDTYLEIAERQEVEIAHVLETHIHADYASGARELAQRTGAVLHESAHDEGERFVVSHPHEDLRDGDRVEIGSVVLEALHTPGHTPEHLTFVLYDTTRSGTEPLLLLTGDFLFVGSLGRPDLLGEDAKRRLAGELFTSARDRLARFGDGVEVHPAHGAGSMCGAGMSQRPTSTLGFERLTNPFLQPAEREAFVERILSTLPPFPPYYARMKAINSQGPAILGGLPGSAAVPVEEFRAKADADHVVIDLRDHHAFGGAHVPGAFGIGAGPNLSTWAAWVVPYDRPILLIPNQAVCTEEAVRALIRVGLDEVCGFLKGGMAAWREAGLPIATLPQISVRDLEQRLADGNHLTVLDVRGKEEWKGGHIRGAMHIMAGELRERVDEVPVGEVAVTCGSGYRSTVAASVLQRAGRNDVLNVTGGMGAWAKAGLPTTQDGGGPAPAPSE